MSSLLLLLSILSPDASAADCDGRALARAVNDAAPVDLADAFVALADCDTRRAEKAASNVVPRILAGDGAAEALVRASALGADKAARSWLLEAEPDVRSRTIEAMGEACSEHPEVVTSFFTDAASALDPTFWEQRWYRGLGSCRTEGVRSLLTAALDHPAVGRGARSRTSFYSLLGTWARNLGTEALPTLDELLANPQDDRDAVSLVDPYADAAAGGEAMGDEDATEQVTGALVAAAPTLPREAVERTRRILISLDAEQASNDIARFAWSDAFDDGYRYGAALTETVTCGNGKVFATLYLGVVEDPAARWPDTVLPSIEETVTGGFEDLRGGRCGTEPTLVVSHTPTPVDAEGLAAFHTSQTTGFEQDFEQAKKTWIETDRTATLP